jgi:hypothetical protein
VVENFSYFTLNFSSKSLKNLFGMYFLVATFANSGGTRKVLSILVEVLLQVDLLVSIYVEIQCESWIIIPLASLE